MLVANRPERSVRLELDDRWTVKLRDPLEPEGYFRLIDAVRDWEAAGSWLTALEGLARQALERRTTAVSQTDINTLTLSLREALLQTLGALVPAGATVAQRDLYAALSANALVRLARRAASFQDRQPVRLAADLSGFLNDHGRIGGITLDGPLRSALVRRTWQLLDQSDGDLLDFIKRVVAAS
jgi:hypothetical protein